jgi:hypothetical protein
MNFLIKYASRQPAQIALIFFFSLLIILATWQVPFSYTVNTGKGHNDSWELTKGWGDQERNDRFSYRWTIDHNTEARIPDVGWPSQVKIVGIGPRPDDNPPQVTLNARGPVKTFTASVQNSVLPPDQDERLTFEVAGPKPEFSLNANRLIISSELYKPIGDPRYLGFLVSQIQVSPQPNQFGFVVPPLAAWTGWSLVVSLLFLKFRQFGRTVIGSQQNLKWAALAGIGGLLVFSGARLAFPQWLCVNGAGIAWGTALPLLAWVVPGKYPARRLAYALWGLIAIGLLLVYYGLALAAFVATIWVVSGLLFLALALKYNFKQHLVNTGLLATLSLGAIWGLLQGQLTRSNDIPFYHLYWINELDRMIEQGNWYPRFAPDFNWGQGGMVFNYYGPMTRYLVEFGHLAGMTFSSAMMFHQVLAVIFGMVGCYFWCDELLKNRLAAILGALAFCYYPYHIGGLYESGWIGNTWAGAFLPWVFLLMTRVVRQPLNRTGPVWLGICVAGLPLNNNPQSILFMPLGGLFVAGLLFIEWRAGKLLFWRTFFNISLGAVVTIALSAFFTIPTFLELDKVGLTDAAPARNFYANWPQDLALWRALRPNMEDYAILGTLHYLLAAAGAAVLWFRQPRLRGFAALLGGLVAVTFFFQWSISSFFWDTFPFFAMINFSSRLMAPAIVFAAPLIGALVMGKVLSTQPDAPELTAKVWPGVLGKVKWGILGAVALTALLIYASLHNLTYVYWPVKFDGTISQRALTEQVYRADVVWLPRGLKNRREIDGYFPPSFNDKLRATPADSLSWRNTGPDSFELTASLSKPGQVTVPLLWFSDSWWNVTDQTGRKYTTSVSEEGRRMMLDLDAGQYTVKVKFQDPPLRTFSNILSILTFLAIPAFLLRSYFRPKRVKPEPDEEPASLVLVASGNRSDTQT